MPDAIRKPILDLVERMEALGGLIGILDLPEGRDPSYIDIDMMPDADETDDYGCPTGEYKVTGLTRKQRVVRAARAALEGREP